MFKISLYKNRDNKRANDGPPHHRASQKYIYQHEDKIVCQLSYLKISIMKSKQKLSFDHNKKDTHTSKSDCISI